MLMEPYCLPLHMTGIVYCDSLKRILPYLWQDVDLLTRIDLLFTLDGALLLVVCVFMKSVFYSNR